MKVEFPAQYAMTFLGFATGLRPSSMRPLRRHGPTPDILWDKGVVLVRRSHTLKDEFMKTTKTNLRRLSRAELESFLTRPAKNPEPTRLWVKRIIRGHEHEFPEIGATPSLQRPICVDPEFLFPHSPLRETGA